MDHSEVKHLPKVDHAPAELDEPAKLLLKAAAYMEEAGFCQGAYERGSRVCTLGALMHVTGSTEGVWNGAMHAAVDRLSVAVGLRIPSWNDTVGRTAEEVISTMRRVALGL